MRLSGRKPSSFTRSWRPRQRLVLLTLIGFNVAAFAVQLFLEVYQPGFVSMFVGLSGEGIQNAYAWQFLTAPFLHTGPWHLLGNTLLLYILGRDVECIVGQRHFLFLYLTGALGGELGHLFLMPAATVLLGASGGVAAVMMAYAAILPELELAATRFFGWRLRITAKHFAYGMMFIAVALLVMARRGTLMHSAYMGGCAAGWLYAHLLGFGRASLVQRTLHQRKMTTERYQQMNAEQFMAEEVDPLLEKISREGLRSLSRGERRILAMAREKLAANS